jgi:lysophospholipid acyltransferase (LPLAT)-like uncharacterized protein|tara:strand:+ start:294 stop:914 length:621 start_codon:yes stop_codon:yes gene_type:complete
MIKAFFKTKVLYLVILLSYRFNRVVIVGENNIKGLDSFILVSWHGKVLGLMEHMRHKGYFALVSKSRDGDLITRIAKKFGYNFFRGSSNKGGKEAIKNIDNFFKKNSGAKIIITPDGPTGPEHKAKPGALILSQNSNRPIVPMIVDVKNSWKFKNWHTFYLSKPFSKMRVVFGEPLYFNKNESIKTGTQKIEDALKKVDRIACDHE